MEEKDFQDVKEPSIEETSVKAADENNEKIVEEAAIEEKPAKEVKETKISETDPLIENLKIDDKYLAKKRRTKKITFGILSGLALALAVVIITLSCIKVDLRPSFLGKPSSYVIKVGSKTEWTIEKSEQEYEEFTNLYLKAFKSQYLSALFTGRLKGFKIEETYETFYSDNTNNRGMSSKLKEYLGSNYVWMTYDELQQIKTPSGKIYHPKRNLTFKDVYFSLNTENKNEDLVFYLGGFLTKSAYIVKITVRANTYDLYSYATK